MGKNQTNVYFGNKEKKKERMEANKQRNDQQVNKIDK